MEPTANTASTATEVLISGAGIAGPALAYWLTRAGYRTTVVERAPDLRPGGQTVDLRGAGRTVMDRMGLLDRARELSVDQRGLALVSPKGRMLAEVPEDAFGGEGIVSEIEILRGDLARLLYDASLPQTEYLFDDTVTALHEDEHGITVGFEKAAPRRFGLVIGADGSHSVVRSLAFGPESEYARPLGIYNAWFTHDALELDGWFQMCNLPGGLVASARPGRLPGEIKAGLSFRSGPISYDRRDTAAQRELVAARFTDHRWEVPRLLRAMQTAPDFFLDSMSQVVMPGWTKGRVALVGDAGYCPSPLTGLGTSLSLVGAYVLAGELATARGDHHRAFRRYDDLMRPYVTQAQELPPGGAAGYAPRSALMIRLRALSMRTMTHWPMRPILAAQFAKAAAIALPDYPALHAALTH
ncbi:FAD-binding monooxygenase [Kitasatospora sp. MMS16-BH015]|uniref:FAD-dependent monooxygenase n=1 Tax=Kitasatospora sp. MMS16-BH015 TaxID=2018025 RepID=UPI000CA2147F|nr:FAD-dependent monooxygenase [Kitasatospora sp. MMS16-BH015]AUG75203.1 FAD-binding monooxygenase [Kitasatospora sp. MMS16-BH015]